MASDFTGFIDFSVTQRSRLPAPGEHRSCSFTPQILQLASSTDNSAPVKTSAALCLFIVFVGGKTEPPRAFQRGFSEQLMVLHHHFHRISFSFCASPQSTTRLHTALLEGTNISEKHRYSSPHSQGCQVPTQCLLCCPMSGVQEAQGCSQGQLCPGRWTRRRAALIFPLHSGLIWLHLLLALQICACFLRTASLAITAVWRNNWTYVW